jgi:virginiamycin B lyase
MQPFSLDDGIGHPWGIAFDRFGNLWFAKAGCEVPTLCALDQPGEIGVIRAGGGQPEFFPLPAVAGNQPLFVAPDDAGAVWFTTPRNAHIGRFDPVTATFEQWAVTPGTGPWQLAFAPDGSLWYTEHFASAVGRFDPVTHAHEDFTTPISNSQPYGIAISGSRVWFTENIAGVGHIGMLDTSANNRIREYQIRAQPSPDLTPHMITLDGSGNVWWTEGFEGEIGKLTPSRATNGTCGGSSGICSGVTEYPIPAPACGRRHGSGIAVRASSQEIWFTDSLSGEVGRLMMGTGVITTYRLGSCNAHAHDGMAVDATGAVWWSEEFSNEIVKFNPPPP